MIRFWIEGEVSFKVGKVLGYAALPCGLWSSQLVLVDRHLENLFALRCVAGSLRFLMVTLETRLRFSKSGV